MHKEGARKNMEIKVRAFVCGYTHLTDVEVRILAVIKQEQTAKALADEYLLREKSLTELQKEEVYK